MGKEKEASYQTQKQHRNGVISVVLDLSRVGKKL